LAPYSVLRVGAGQRCCWPLNADPLGGATEATFMRIKLSDERRSLLIAATQAHFRDQFDDNIGELKAGLILDFFVKSLGPPVYNQAIRDAHGFIQEKLVDLQGEFYEPEEER
jgi:uncharacterized protein (DUF2164 family)